MNDSNTREQVNFFGNLLDDQLLYYRRSVTGERTAATLPDLFVAMAQDSVRDFPALRPHQRHPWHAFLVQLAEIALHHAGRTEPFETASEWRSALLALTPDDPDGAAWCLVSPVNRPAFMQAPEPSGRIDDWKVRTTADEIDMLITAKNHDLKTNMMQRSMPEDWIYALISLQTQDGYLGAGNYGISRMNGGSTSRCGVGIKPNGMWGKRWRRDLRALSDSRSESVERFGLAEIGGNALLWIYPWDGKDSFTFASLDPWYIEICRRVRLFKRGEITARLAGSKVARVSAKDLSGVTGDPWMPVDVAERKSLTISTRGFDYKLATELLLGEKYSKPPAQIWLTSDDSHGVQLIAQGVARSQGKTEVYHERRIPISRKLRQGFLMKRTDEFAKLAEERIIAIAELRKLLWAALTVLFANGARDESGKDKPATDYIKEQAGIFSQPFEAECDACFFVELSEEIEADDHDAIRTQWLLTLAERAECVLRSAFVAGPRSGQLRYRAQGTALNRLHAGMRGKKLPALANALKAQLPKEDTDDHA